MFRKSIAIVFAIIIVLTTGLGAIYAQVSNLISRPTGSVTQQVYGTVQKQEPETKTKVEEKPIPVKSSKDTPSESSTTPPVTSKPRTENKPDEFTGPNPATEGQYIAPATPPQPVPAKDVLKDPCTVIITSPKPNSVARIPLTVTWSITNRTNFRPEYMFYVKDLTTGKGVYSTDTGSRTSITIPSDVGQGPILVQNHKYEIRVTTNLIYTGSGRTPFPLLDTTENITVQ